MDVLQPPTPDPGAESLRSCKVCETPRAIHEFEATSMLRSGKVFYRRICRYCRNVSQRKKLRDSRSSIEAYSTVLVKRARERARKRGFDHVSLTEGWVVAVWDQQKGRCFYSAVPLETISGPRLVTVERLDVSKGYEPDNCVLACLCVNMMRASTPTDEFTWWCAQVAENSPVEAREPQKTSDKEVDE